MLTSFRGFIVVGYLLFRFASADHSIHRSIESTSISDPLIDPSLVNRLVFFLGGSSDVFSPSSIVS